MTDGSDAINSVTSIAYAGISLGALALALDFVGKASKGFPEEKQRKSKSRTGLFDMGYDDMFYSPKKSKKRNDDLFDWGF